MRRVLTNIEFFTFEDEVWLRTRDGETRRLLERDTDLLRSLSDCIATFYPQAFSALNDEYKACAANRSYQRFRIVCRFIKCNFCALDSVPDFDSNLHATFEHVNCPLRGECRYDGVICRPEFATQLSAAELRVLKLVYAGMSEEGIGEQLKLSPHTVHTHIRNAYTRLGIHSKGEFIKYASLHHIFK